MGCIFCSICDKSVNSWTIYEDDDIQAFFDYNPASRGHVLIVPREHYTNIYDIPNSYLEKIIIFAKKLCLLYKELY